MTKAKRKILTDFLFVVIACAVALLGWTIAAKAADSEFVVPGLTTAFGALRFVLTTEQFWTGLAGTLLRCTIGFFIALGLFLITFYLSTAFYAFKRIVEPILSALRSLPAVAVTLILIISVGQNGAPIVLGVTVIYPIMYSSARSRVATAEKELLEICRINGASKWAVFRAVWFPCLAGGLAESLASAFSYNVKAVIGAEILAQTAASLGMLMKLSQIYLQPEMLVAYVICAVVAAAVCEGILRLALGTAFKKYVP